MIKKINENDIKESYDNIMLSIQDLTKDLVAILALMLTIYGYSDCFSNTLHDQKISTIYLINNLK